MRFRNLAQEIDRLHQGLDAIDVRVPEDSALIALAADLAQPLVLLMDRAIELMRDAEDFYTHREEDEPHDSDPHSLRGIGFLISSTFAARDVTDVAYFARSDLRSCADGLRAALEKGTTSMEAMAGQIESSLKRLRKALISIESALYEYEELEAPRREWSDLDVSLQIRKLYWLLRQETANEPADDDHFSEGLRRVVYRLIAFREHQVYPLLRIDDRLQLRNLLKRILDWLNVPNHNLEEGRHLWKDLAGFAEILIQVSQRQELKEHDRRVVKRAYNRLFRTLPMPERVPEDVFAELESLLGIDETLDRLVMGRCLGSVEPWREPLIRLQEYLSRLEEIGTFDVWTTELI